MKGLGKQTYALLKAAALEESVHASHFGLGSGRGRKNHMVFLLKNNLIEWVDCEKLLVRLTDKGKTITKDLCCIVNRV